MRKGLEEDLGPEAATPGTRGTARRGEATQLPCDLKAGEGGGIAASQHLRWGIQVGREAGFPLGTREAKGFIGGNNRGQR